MVVGTAVFHREPLFHEPPIVAKRGCVAMLRIRIGELKLHLRREADDTGVLIINAQAALFLDRVACAYYEAFFDEFGKLAQRLGAGQHTSGESAYDSASAKRETSTGQTPPEQLRMDNSRMGSVRLGNSRLVNLHLAKPRLDKPCPDKLIRFGSPLRENLRSGIDLNRYLRPSGSGHGTGSQGGSEDTEEV